MHVKVAPDHLDDYVAVLSYGQLSVTAWPRRRPALANLTGRITVSRLPIEIDVLVLGA